MEPNNATGGYIFKEWELLEFSAVAVPANQDAIAQAVKSFGDRGRDIIDPLERIKALEEKVFEKNEDEVTVDGNPIEVDEIEIEC